MPETHTQKGEGYQVGGAQGGEGEQGGGGDSEWGAQRGEGLAERVRGPGERVRAGTGVERRGDLGFSKLGRGLYSWDRVERPLNAMCRILSALALSDVISDFSPGSDFDVRRGENSPSLELASAVTGMLACVRHRLWTGGGGICSKIVCTGPALTTRGCGEQPDAFVPCAGGRWPLPSGQLGLMHSSDPPLSSPCVG